MRRHLIWLVIILAISGTAIWVSLPDNPEFEQPLGLDLVGGYRVLLQAELPSDAYTTDELRETANSVSRRINALGLSEATVQLQGSSRILVELPGEDDPERARETIQQTALLEFVDFANLQGTMPQEGELILTTAQYELQQQREALALEQAQNNPESTAEPDDGVVEPPRRANQITGLPFDTVITGDHLTAAVAEYTGVQWTIRFELDSEGADLFEAYTSENINQPMAIVLDGEVLSAPIVQGVLSDSGSITGQFTEDEAKQLALQLRSGSLAIPLRIESSERVGATLGQESVDKSIKAGVVGVIVVLAFMLFYYRLPGVAADGALLVFIIMNLALFKLIPITLTLPAITGFLISIGTAVDGNILIFERIKEELREGKDLDDALDFGFDRAWTSIRDSNLSTIIICGVLFFFGQTPGASIVSGFAITLALGLILNLFTAIIVTRTFLYLLVDVMRSPIQARQWLLGT